MVYEITETHKGTILRRKIGEGTFIGLKRAYNRPEELVQWLKCLYAYRYAERFAEGKSVLDLGCGTGYGIHELSTKSIEAVGIDIWKEGIYYSHNEYGNKTSFLVASALSLPFRNESFDLAVSFQVIEHIEPYQVIEYLEEIKRVLKDGKLIVSTPNSRLRLLPLQKPWNNDHKKEYDQTELEKVLKMVFENVDVSGLFARKDVYLVEYYRVKQNPFLVYPLLIAGRILPAYLFKMLKKFLIKSRKLSLPKIENRTNSLVLNISLNDFQTSRKNLETCIDLYGTCIKSERGTS